MWRDGTETFYKSFENAELHRQFGESLSELLKALKEALSTVAGLTSSLCFINQPIPSRYIS